MKLIDNSAKTNWIFVVIVAVIGLLVGGGILWYSNSLKLSERRVSSSSLPNDQQSAIDMSNWQTYRNEEFGFEVKYSSQILPAPYRPERM